MYNCRDQTADADAAAQDTTSFLQLRQQLLIGIFILLTALPLHRANLAMCICAFALLLKNAGLPRASQVEQTYRVTLVMSPL